MDYSLLIVLGCDYKVLHMYVHFTQHTVISAFDDGSIYSCTVAAKKVNGSKGTCKYTSVEVPLKGTGMGKNNFPIFYIFIMFKKCSF